MSVWIGAARIAEDGTIHGEPGDQTKKEVCVHEWYDDDWTHVLRPLYNTDAEEIARNMEKACENDNIGYSQKNRTTLYKKALYYGSDISKISSPCDCDCSSLVGCCLIMSGINVSPSIYTGNMVNAILNTGRFNVMITPDYLYSPDKLKRGDILVSEYNHTAIVLSNGSAIEPPPVKVDDAMSFNPEVAGVYRAVTDCYIRCGASKKRQAIGVLKSGNVCRCYGYYTDENGKKWLYIQRSQLVGFISEVCLVKT